MTRAGGRTPVRGPNGAPEVHPSPRRRLVSMGAVALTVTIAGATAAVAIRHHAAGSPAVAPQSAALPTITAGFQNWTMHRHDPSHSGVSGETILGASNASSLRLHWTAATGAKSYSSPAVVFNPILNRTLVYVGNQVGMMKAFDAANGQLVWAYQVPKTAGVSKEIETSPAFSGNTVYFGVGDYHEYALNATTGALICTSPSVGGIIAGSATVANPDGSGDVVYFGDSGVSGSLSDGGHEWAMNGVGNSGGPACSIKWKFDGFGSPAGSQTGISGVYSTQAFGILANGTPVVVTGSTDPDDSIYEINATTGAMLWRFQTAGGTDADIGAPATISAPGVNGFANGVVYDTAKDAKTYALDLQTGAQIWMFDIKHTIGKGNPAQSGASLVGNTVYIGYGGGVFALNATTGAATAAQVVWTSQPVTAGVVSSPSISGATGNRVIFVGDLSGTFRAFSVATGLPLFSYPAGGLFFASAAVSTGQVFISGTNGNLYAFGL